VIKTSTPGRQNLACLILCFFCTLSDTVSPTGLPKSQFI
jgi:hypothetical protein